jgi:hypothetical protein
MCSWLLAAFACLVILWLVFGFYRPFEPHYHGKCLSRWADDVVVSDISINGDNDLPEVKLKGKNGAEAIRQIGVKALPLALKLCQAQDSNFKSKLGGAIRDWKSISFVDPYLRHDLTSVRKALRFSLRWVRRQNRPSPHSST